MMDHHYIFFFLRVGGGGGGGDGKEGCKIFWGMKYFVILPLRQKIMACPLLILWRQWFAFVVIVVYSMNNLSL